MKKRVLYCFVFLKVTALSSIENPTLRIPESSLIEVSLPLGEEDERLKSSTSSSPPQQRN